MRFALKGRSIEINGTEIHFVPRVFKAVELEDRVILELNTDDYSVGDPEIGRNIVCYGADGTMLWQIEPTGVMCTSRLGGLTPEAFFNLHQHSETGEITIGTPDGWIFKLDPETGKYFDGVFLK